MTDEEKAARFRKIAAQLRLELAAAHDEATRRALSELVRQYEALADWVARRQP